jgi:hypothetical protein
MISEKGYGTFHPFVGTYPSIRSSVAFPSGLVNGFGRLVAAFFVFFDELGIFLYSFR